MKNQIVKLSSLFPDSARSAARRDRSRLILTFGVVLYVVRVIAPGWRSGFPLFFPDSSSYVDVSRLGPLNPSFWWSQRPVGVPLMIWATGGNHRLFFLVQTVLFAVAVAYLCSVLLAIITRRWLAWITCALIASISVHPRFGLWHLEILSESLSLTLSVLMIAVWLRFSHDPRRRHLITGIAVTVAWMSLRDVNIVMGFVVALALLASGIVARTWSLRKVAMVGAAVIASFGSYVLMAQTVSDRNIHPLINNVGKRVLPNPEITKTFVDHGMPLDETLRARTGSDSWSDDQAFLLDPDLKAFRSWADDRGQRALLTSLVVDAAFWIDTTKTVLDSTLPLDFTEYDRYATSDRLPTRLFWFQGPRTPMQLALWATATAISMAAVAAVAIRRLTKRPKGPTPTSHAVPAGLGRTLIVSGVAFTAMFADVFLSASGDSVEVQRHVLGSVFRISVSLVLVVALMIHVLIAMLTTPRTTSQTAQSAQSKISMSTALAISLGIIGVFGAWIALEHRTRDFDPQYVRTVIERAARYGGTYYENGIHNKGPLETFVYDSVRLFTTFDTYWFGISVLVLIVSGLLGWTAWAIARSITKPTSWAKNLSNTASLRIAGLSAALVAIHFAISESDYAGVLYSRNITTVMMAVVVALTVWDRPWQRRAQSTAVFLGSIALLGLAVQTLLPTVFAAAVIGTFLFVRRSAATGLRNPAASSIITGATTLASAPVWYALRGSFTEFWASWWTYAGFMSSSTGRSLLDQIGLGGQKLFGYYQERPAILFVIVAFAFFARRNWATMSTATRTLHTMLFAWLAAGWVELVLSQRYSSHYFSVIAVPTAFIAVCVVVAVVDLLGHFRETRGLSLWGAMASVVALLATQGTHLTWIAIEGAGRFRSTDHYVQARAELRTGPQLTRRAVMDLASSANDPLLAWTMYPWTYLEYQRVPATRLSWKSFMIGEIYLGRTSSRYVLDGTWEWFTDDLAESRPQVYARPQVTPLVPGIPFTSFVAETFTPVYADEDLDIQWRTDLWDSVTDDASNDRVFGPEIDLPEGWSIDAADQLITARSGASSWSLPIEPCQRMTTRLVRASPADPMGLSIHFTPMDSSLDPVALHIDFDQSWSTRRADDIGPGVSTQLDSQTLVDARRTELDVTLLLTHSSAALVVDGRIVSAVLIDHPSAITMTPAIDELVIRTPSVGKIPTLAGC